MKTEVKKAVKTAVTNIKVIETTGTFLALSYYIARDIVHVPFQMANAIGFARD